METPFEIKIIVNTISKEKYQSPSLWLRQSKVESDLNEITENLRSSNTENSRGGDVAPIKVFSGELTEKGEEAFSKLKKSAYILSEKTKGGFDLAIVEPNSDFDGALHNGTMYISADTLEKGTWVKPLIEETTHFTEGTKEYAKYVQFLAKDPELMADALDKIVDTEDSQKGYGFTKELAEGAVDKLDRFSMSSKMLLNENGHTKISFSKASNNGTEIPVSEVEHFIKSVLSMKDSSQISKRKKKLGTVSSSHAEILNQETGIDVKDYEIWIDGSSVFHINDRHGKNGKADHTMQDVKDFSRIAYVVNNADGGDLILSEDGSPNVDSVYKNKDQSQAVRVKMYVRESDGIFYVVECVPDNTEKRLYIKSAYKQKNSGKDQELNIDDNSPPQQTPETFLDSSATEDSIPESSEKVNTSEEDFLNDEETEFLSEWNAHASAELLGGNEEFVDKLIREDTGLAQKLFNHIKTLVKSVENINNPEARAEYQRLKKAEKLFLKAVSKAGGQYVNGKIVMRKRDEEEQNKAYLSMEDFIDKDSPVWKNVDYDDKATQQQIMRETHTAMANEGSIVTVSEDIQKTVEQSYPDLRGMKKKDRVPILKESMNKLKNNIREFLNGFKNQGFEFEVNGKVLEAKLYNTGINEVLEKITQDKASMLYATEEIFKKSRYLYSTPDYDSDPNVYRWNYFYTPVQIGEETVGVRIAVRDVLQGQEHRPESQIYNWGIKKDATLGGVQPVVSDSSHGASSDASANSIPDSEQNVKRKTQFSRKSSPQQAQNVANRNQKKVYTQKNARSIIRTVVGEQLGFGKFYGKMSGKNQEYAVNWLWEARN